MFQPPCMVPTYYTAVIVSAYLTDSMPTYFLNSWLNLNSYQLKEERPENQSRCPPSTRLHPKKKFASFPSPAGMSLTNSPWAGIMTS